MPCAVTPFAPNSLTPPNPIAPAPRQRRRVRQIDEPDTPFADYDPRDDGHSVASASEAFDPGVGGTGFDGGVGGEGVARPENMNQRNNSVVDGVNIRPSQLPPSTLMLNWGALENKLAGVVAARERYPSISSASKDEDDIEDDIAEGGGDGGADNKDGAKEREEEERRRREMEEGKREIQFSVHRKHHYNEMEMLRRWRAENPSGDEDDAEDDDEKGEDMDL